MLGATLDRLPRCLFATRDFHRRAIVDRHEEMHPAKPLRMLQGSRNVADPKVRGVGAEQGIRAQPDLGITKERLLDFDPLRNRFNHHVVRGFANQRTGRPELQHRNPFTERRDGLYGPALVWQHHLCDRIVQACSILIDQADRDFGIKVSPQDRPTHHTCTHENRLGKVGFARCVHVTVHLRKP